MSTACVMKITFAIAGIIIIFLSFLMYSKKKLIVNLAIMWEMLGIIVFLTGVVPAFSNWCSSISAGTAILIFIAGVLLVPAGYTMCISISELTMKNQELAMQVSLLNQENEKILSELSHILNDNSAGKGNEKI